MISHAGFGVAMGNASDPVREAARVVTAPNTRNGVARIIRTILDPAGGSARLKECDRVLYTVTFSIV